MGISMSTRLLSEAHQNGIRAHANSEAHRLMLFPPVRKQKLHIDAEAFLIALSKEFSDLSSGWSFGRYTVTPPHLILQFLSAREHGACVAVCRIWKSSIPILSVPDCAFSVLAKLPGVRSSMLAQLRPVFDFGFDPRGCRTMGELAGFVLQRILVYWVVQPLCDDLATVMIRERGVYCHSSRVCEVASWLTCCCCCYYCCTGSVGYTRNQLQIEIHDMISLAPSLICMEFTSCWNQFLRTHSNPALLAAARQKTPQFMTHTPFLVDSKYDRLDHDASASEIIRVWCCREQVFLAKIDSFYGHFVKKRRQSHFSGRMNELVAFAPRVPRVFLHEREFNFLAPIQAAWKEIRAEFENLYLHHSHRFELWEDDEYKKEEVYSGGWRLFGLMMFGYAFPVNQTLAPLTSHLLSSIPKLTTAGFSVLTPGTHLMPHSDFKTTTGTRCHLGLIVPIRSVPSSILFGLPPEEKKGDDPHSSMLPSSSDYAAATSFYYDASTTSSSTTSSSSLSSPSSTSSSSSSSTASSSSSSSSTPAVASSVVTNRKNQLVVQTGDWRCQPVSHGLLGEECVMRVSAHSRGWEEGQWNIFDGTSQHEVINPTNGHRVVLLLDFGGADVPVPMWPSWLQHAFGRAAQAP